MKVAIYLRKSRADEELEKTLGEGETLSKHRKALLKFAKEKKLDVIEIVALLYQVVSAISFSIPPIILNALEFSINSFHS